MEPAPQPSQPSQPPEPPKDARLIELAQRFNDQFGTILKWTGFLGFVGFAATDHLPIAMAFFGAIPVSLTIGKTGK